MGWILKPNLSVDQAFSTKKKLRTNSHGFRGENEFLTKVPSGKKRILCSGDSFTFGDEVNDEETWCQALTAMNSSLESINLGEAGYGIDQSYLKFQQIQKSFDYDIHVLAFITDDFERMRRSDFVGYPKPILERGQGELRVANYPVPTLKSANRSTWMHALTGLRLGSVYWSIQSAFQSKEEVLPRSKAFSILETIIEKSRGTGKRLLLVHLPCGNDFYNRGSDFLSDWFQNSLAMENYLNLIEEFRTLKHSTAKSYFNGDLENSHYSPTGNGWVARKILERLSLE